MSDRIYTYCGANLGGEGYCTNVWPCAQHGGASKAPECAKCGASFWMGSGECSFCAPHADSCVCPDCSEGASKAPECEAEHGTCQCRAPKPDARELALQALRDGLSCMGGSLKECHECRAKALDAIRALGGEP